jgi:uncharacterized protein (TIGR02598 family)
LLLVPLMAVVRFAFETSPGSPCDPAWPSMPLLPLVPSFPFVPLMPFMPGGLSNLQAAERREAEARIYQALVSEYETKPWKKLENFTRSDVQYFDTTGLPLPNLTDDVAFSAMVERDTTPMKLPGQSDSPFLLHFRIAISSRPRDSSTLFSIKAMVGARRDFGLVIVNEESTK